ncbi:MAG: NYN domain-containing protein [Actinomycetota bacterium]
MKALLVDGYNLIYAHPRLADAMRHDQEKARQDLVRELSSLANPGRYDLVVVVFDAAGSDQAEPVAQRSEGMTVVFTRRRQSADAFIEGLARRLLPGNEVVVASSDRMLANLVGGFGARVVEGPALLEAAGEARQDTREELRRRAGSGRSPLEERISDEVRRLLDEMRYR